METNKGRIVVHPNVVERSERLRGVGCTFCNDMNTGKTFQTYNLERITEAEREFDSAIKNDFRCQVARFYLGVSILYGAVKKKVEDLRHNLINYLKENHTLS